MDYQSLDVRAQQLVERLARRCEDDNVGSATIAIYDTAWVSMILKVTDGKSSWLFPECFQFVLEAQSTDGGWGAHFSDEDGLLNTLAALLAMKKHSALPSLLTHIDLDDLNARIIKARNYLQHNLQIWDIEASKHVGFEVLVPAILSMLEREDIRFEFEARKALDRLNALKLAHFDPEILYGSPSTLLHSLEAFKGRIDFDRLKSHKQFGSMMASPSSTAAFLMYSSIWDDEAERYIRRVINDGQGQGGGGVPSVFPTPIFESTWVVSTLLASGFSVRDLGETNLRKIALYLERYFEIQRGLIGFAPSVLADADDTAKTILTLELLERPPAPDQMIDHFKSNHGHFRTYPGERDMSISANCNVLKALLHASEVQRYSSHIIDITNFLCDSWWKGTVKDKWNTSEQYTMMLVAEGLTSLLYICNTGLLNDVPDTILRDRIPVVLTQILNRTLFAQKETGRWGSDESLEVTAYGVLTLKTVSSLPWHFLLYDTIESSIQSGQKVLSQSQDDWSKPCYRWIEKVTFGSATLSEAYCLAAMKPRGTSHAWSVPVTNLIEMPEKEISKFVGFFSTLKDFQGEPAWKFKASAIESFTILPQLKSARVDILPNQRDAKNEYFAYIPFTWVLINNLHCLNSSTDLLWDMIVLTVCNFRVDEYMETTVAKLSKADLEQIKSIICELCTDELSDAFQPRKNAATEEDRGNEDRSATSNLEINGSLDGRKEPRFYGMNTIATEAYGKYPISLLIDFRAVIGHYTRAMLAYPRVLNASPADHSHFRRLMRTFLLSHVFQVADNSRFATQASKGPSATNVFADPSTSFYAWVHTIGADSVSCPFSFAFFTCLLGVASTPSSHTQEHKLSDDCFSSARQKYLAEDLCTHLAVMSRMYNDFGSVARDSIEANINSINFPEFHIRANDFTSEGAEPVPEATLKAELLELAQHERDQADKALERFLADLEGKSAGCGRRNSKQKANAVRLFAGVTKLYADIYVARDLSNRVNNLR